MRGGLVIRVRLEPESGAAEQRLVIIPGWLTDPEPRIGTSLENETSRYPQGSRATGCLQRRKPIGRYGGTESHSLHAGIECRRADRTDIRLRSLIIDEALLGLLDGFEHGCFTSRIPINTDAEIDFFWSLVIAMLSDQAEDCIRRHWLQRFKHGVLQSECVDRDS